MFRTNVHGYFIVYMVILLYTECALKNKDTILSAEFFSLKRVLVLYYIVYGYMYDYA